MDTTTPKVERAGNGDWKLAPQESVLRAMALAAKDGDIVVSTARFTDNAFHVTTLDGDIWGVGPDMDTALRYALGAHFAPSSDR